MTLTWIVVQTYPLSEERVLRHLTRQGFISYAPRCLEGKVVRLLFPRYVFVLMETLCAWRPICETFGVLSILKGILPDRWITTLKSQERNGVVTIPKKRWQVGKRVKIIHGHFQGYSGLYQGMSSRQREVVMLDILGRVELAKSDLQEPV